MANAQLSQLGQLVRRHDPDRFFTALFAPYEHREALFALYAFNHEIARATEVVREPIAAMVRLQWWRDVLEGARPRHEVATPLAAAIDSGRFQPTELGRMVDAREAELDPIEDLATFIAMMEGGAGQVMVTAGRLLGMAEPESLRLPGSAYGVSDLLRTARLQTDAGARKRRLIPLGDSEAIRRLALTWCGQRIRVPRSALAAALPTTLARRRLRSTPRIAGDRWAVMASVLTGRP